ATLIAACGKLGGVDAGLAEAPVRPNVLLIVTDDQPAGMTKRMPKLNSAEGFAKFSSYYDNNPLCCPTRATLLNGQYSHNHRVETNLVANRFDDTSTLATWLDAAGYETGLFGKYMNNYPWNRGAGYVPPGWDRWSAFKPDADYYDYTLVEDGQSRRYGNSPADYSTDVLAGQVDEFIRTSEEPFFAYFAPYGAHAPRTPAPRHRGAFSDARVKLPPNFNRIAHTAPRWWQKRDRLSRAAMRKATVGQWRTLLSVDDAIARFLRTIDQVGEADNTIVVFLSDNGYSLGSHRYQWKDCPYEECIHLPLLVRWPGQTDAGQPIDALAGSMDIAPTIAELAGATPTTRMDGTSLVPLLTGARSSLDRPVLLRHVQYPRVPPSFWGVRTERFTYVIWESGERELYDNRRDRAQLRNLAGKRAYRGAERDLDRTIAELRRG
ncbi:MAG TPA: sulfatase, partial [Solirubrobacterales bacterium]|nr:sulfatase [Solirubrobacterales bacterium]